MSLIAASFKKSAIVGLMPRAELTPVFSPTDWAIADVANRTSARPGARYFIVGVLSRFGFRIQINGQCSLSFLAPGRDLYAPMPVSYTPHRRCRNQLDVRAVFFIAP